MTLLSLCTFNIFAASFASCAVLQKKAHWKAELFGVQGYQQPKEFNKKRGNTCPSLSFAFFAIETQNIHPASEGVSNFIKNKNDLKKGTSTKFGVCFKQNNPKLQPKPKAWNQCLHLPPARAAQAALGIGHFPFSADQSVQWPG